MASRQEKELVKCRKLVDDGVEAEQRMLNFVDTLQTAMNTRVEPLNQTHATVPDPHPCSKDILSSLNDADEWIKTTKNLLTSFNVTFAARTDIASPGDETLNADSTIHLTIKLRPRSSLKKLAKRARFVPKFFTNAMTVSQCSQHSLVTKLAC